MPLWPGTDLFQWCSQRGGPPIDPSLAVGILAQVCAGVSAMHDKTLTHGDIKPKNILVSETFEVVLADLGLACRASERAASVDLVGTPGYVAPELLLPSDTRPDIAPRADVYAIGATAYWLLTGRLPAGSNDPFDLPTQWTRRYIPPPSELRPELSRRYDAPILQAIHRDPIARPDARGLRDELLAARDHSPESIATPLVVLIDDDPDALMFIEAVIDQALPNAETVAMRDPHAALALIQSRRPDLIITDLQMPGLGGIELTAAMRRRAKTRDIPIVVLTGIGGAEDWKRLRELGAAHLLLKPIDPDSLHDVVRRAVRKRDGDRTTVRN